MIQIPIKFLAVSQIHIKYKLKHSIIFIKSVLFIVVFKHQTGHDISITIFLRLPEASVSGRGD